MSVCMLYMLIGVILYWLVVTVSLLIFDCSFCFGFTTETVRYFWGSIPSTPGPERRRKQRSCGPAQDKQRLAVPARVPLLLL